MCFINTRKCHVNFYSKKKKSHFSWQYWHLFWLRVCKVVLTLIGPKENYVFHFLVHTSDTFPHLSPPELSMFSLSWAWQPGFLLMALKTVRETPSQKVHRVPICLGKSQNEAGEVQPPSAGRQRTANFSESSLISFHSCSTPEEADGKSGRC